MALGILQTRILEHLQCWLLGNRRGPRGPLLENLKGDESY